MSDPTTTTNDSQDIDAHIADLVKEAKAAGHSDDDIVEALELAAEKLRGADKDEDDAA